MGSGFHWEGNRKHRLPCWALHGWAQRNTVHPRKSEGRVTAGRGSWNSKRSRPGASTFPRASDERSSAESKMRSNAEKVGTCCLEE